MKYLNKFYNYINESLVLDIDELKDTLVSLQDINEVKIIENSIFFRNEYRKAYTLNIDISKLKKDTIIVSSFERTVITDDVYWEILDELITIKNRLNQNSHKIIFEPFINSYSHTKFEISKILIHIILDELSKNILEEYYDKINSKLNRMRTDFSYNTVVTKSKEKLTIKSYISDYTDRKFNNLIHEVIDKEKVEIDKYVDNRSGYITITIKLINRKYTA